MGTTVQRQGFIKATELVTALANDLIANGFELMYLNGVAGNVTQPDGETTDVYLQATRDVDPLCPQDNSAPQEGDQPWIIHITARTEQGVGGFDFNADGHINWMRIDICTPSQIIENPDGTWRVAYKLYQNFSRGEDRVTSTRNEAIAGMLSYGSYRIQSSTSSGGGTDPSGSATFGYFYCFNAYTANEQNVSNVNSPNWGKSGDFAAHPLSYHLTTSDHGIVFAMWGESYDSTGEELAWFCTQRMVNKDDGTVVVDGKAPLFTVYSLEGNRNSNLNEPDEDQIMYMVTRESDVNTPTFPRSATVDQADSNRIINAVQQVAIGEDENFIVHFPNGLNTQRYGYPDELDLIAYTSADALSSENEIELTVYGEANPRKYVAVGSNNTFNKGMRMLVQIEGVGIDTSRS
jgi:hypothetical protein